MDWANLLSSGSQWLTGVAVTKSLIAFVVAFMLAALFSFLSLASRLTLISSLAPNDFLGLGALNNAIAIALNLACLGVFFGAFYFLGKNHITASKSTVLAMIIGVIMGSAIMYPLILVTSSSISFGYYLTMLGGLVTAVFQCFLPALTALLFVELRQKTQKAVEEIPPNVI